jgi:hypothetical protein
MKGLSKQNNYQEWLLRIMAILVIVCTTIYGVNDLVFYLYDTILGNILLLVIIIIVGINDTMLAFITGILFILIYIYHRYYQNQNLNKNKNKEGFTWSQTDINNFLLMQQTVSPNTVYDIETLKKYVSRKELDDYLMNGKWTWTPETQQRYKTALDENQYVRFYKKDGLHRAQQVYNEYAINYILDNQEKSKQYNEMPKQKPCLPSGWGSYGYNSGLI